MVKAIPFALVWAAVLGGFFMSPPFVFVSIYATGSLGTLLMWVLIQVRASFPPKSLAGKEVAEAFYFNQRYLLALVFATVVFPLRPYLRSQEEEWKSYKIQNSIHG